MRKMKDSGIEWIGMIPEGWEVCRLKNIVACHDELRKPISADKRENHLKLYDYYGASGVIDTIDDYNVDGTVLLIGEDGANLKLRNLPLIYRASGKFWVNNHAHILIVNKKHSYDYVAYLLEAGDYSNYITGSAQPKLSQFNLMRFPVAIPNYTEQENISFFIHRECSKIDSILSETRSSIEEYKKLKQAVITQAVTKGVRGEQKMKDSGVEWIGKVPSKWNCIKIKYLFEIRKRIAGKEGYTVLSITQTGIKPKNISSNEGQLADSYSNYQLLHFGEFAMNHMDLLTGWVDISNYNGVTSPDYRVFSLKDTITNHPRYFLYLMQMCYFNRIFYSMAQGVSCLLYTSPSPRD